jgi:hypothetical protein
MALMTKHSRTLRHAAPGTSGLRYPWPLMLIAAPAATAIWSGWVGLGGMCGFGPIRPLPGIADSITVNTAITLPVGVEAYGAYALYVWLGGRASETTRQFARTSAFTALALGCLGQVTFHLLAAAHWAEAPWPVVMAVACLPVVTLSLAAALVHLTHADLRAAEDATAEPAGNAGDDAAMPPPEDATPEDVPEAMPVPAGVAPALPVLVQAEMPEAAPPREPRRRPSGPSRDPDAEKARKAYRESVRAGQPLSSRKLGGKYGRSRTWGQSRIDEVNEGPALAAKGAAR